MCNQKYKYNQKYKLSLQKSQILSHGGALTQVKEQNPDYKGDWIDLSTGISPWFYNPSIENNDIDQWNKLPDTDLETKLKNVASLYFKTLPRQILPISGIQSFLNILAFIIDDDAIFSVCSPTYNEYTKYAQLMNSKIVILHDIDSFLQQNDLSKTHIIIFGNPNNPDGRCFTPEEIKNLCQSVNDKSLIIIDEAFFDFFDMQNLTTNKQQIVNVNENKNKICVSMVNLVDEYDNLIILKSFGKFFGLAGIRLGFIISQNRNIEYFENFLLPWNVSVPALQIGIQAYQNIEWAMQNTLKISKISRIMQQILQHAGLKIISNVGLFLTVSTENLTPEITSKQLYQALCKNGIYVRIFDDDIHLLRFGLVENMQYLEKLTSCLRPILKDFKVSKL